MQVLQAGPHKLIYLELQPELVAKIARDAGFDTRTKDGPRIIQLDLSAPAGQSPILLFDAADPANLGWFSRCQFHVDGRSGVVLQTPITLANRRDRSGHGTPQLRAAGNCQGTSRHVPPAGQAAPHRTGFLRFVLQLLDGAHQERRGGLRRRGGPTAGRADRGRRLPQLICALRHLSAHDGATLPRPAESKCRVWAGTGSGGTVRLRPTSLMPAPSGPAFFDRTP